MAVAVVRSHGAAVAAVRSHGAAVAVVPSQGVAVAVVMAEGSGAAVGTITCPHHASVSHRQDTWAVHEDSTCSTHGQYTAHSS